MRRSGSRVVLSVLMLILVIVMQLFLLAQIKTFCTSPYVAEIRGYYDTFERTMYDGHVQETEYGFALGKGGKEGPFFDMSKFASLSDGTKKKVCTIPFSQFNFLFVILFVWTLSVIGELKVCLRHAHWLWARPAVPYMEDALAVSDCDREVIQGATISMKAFIALFILLPRVLVSIILLWLGCRWLSATADYDDLLVNVVALEFILTLNHLLYEKLMSDKNKREITEAKIDMRDSGRIRPSLTTFVLPFGYGLAAAAWAWFYMVHFQMVLPGYQWDVRDACASYVAQKYNFWRK